MKDHSVKMLSCHLSCHLRTVTAVTTALFSITCRSPTSPSKTIVIPPPTITCPVPPSAVTAANGQSAAVSYGSPTVKGGSTPVSVSCAPPSGSPFPVGSTSITCSATDVVHRTAECSFTVSVSPPPPRLGVTTILAFGDSITEGEVPVAGEFSLRPQFVEPDKSYPADLSSLLSQRYTAQGATRVDAFCATNPPLPMSSGIVVINAGCLGERAEDATTLARLNDKLATYDPNIVLLLEGVNDLDRSRPTESISGGVQGVRALIGVAQSRGARVIVGTLPPEIAMDLTHGGAPDLIVPFNAQLTPTAASAGVSIVDVYGDIVRDVEDWISPYDGLHLTEAGYQEMARVWLNSIQLNFELPPAPTIRTNMSKVLSHVVVSGGAKR
jgi:lysophospholipase L1-like esterase